LRKTGKKRGKGGKKRERRKELSSLLQAPAVVICNGGLPYYFVREKMEGERAFGLMYIVTFPPLSATGLLFYFAYSISE